MAAINASAFAEALADERMLDAEQYAEFESSMFPLCQDVTILARELIYRQWLTPYQVEVILDGNAKSLFLGSYVLLEPLGEGGMGRVFRARNWKLKRQVAIKVIREEQTEQPAVVARFQREVRALGYIKHINIVRAIDADFQGRSIWYAMEYVNGIDLGRYVRTRGPMSVEDARNYVVQIADGLQHAHDHGLVHRDIKPSNLILCESDRLVKLLDLGLTRAELPIDDSAFADLTRAGAIIGTPDFMSPEQIKDPRSADVRSDIYSLGCTFYYMLTGRAPFEEARAMVDKLMMQCEDEPTAVERLRSDIPAETAQVLRKMMAKDRRERYQLPAEVISALLNLGEQPRRPLHNAQTIVDSGIVAAFDMPTQMLSHCEMETGELVSERDATRRKNARTTNWGALARMTVAVLLATLAMVFIWQTGNGPGSLRGNSPGRDTEKTNSRSQQTPRDSNNGSND